MYDNADVFSQYHPGSLLWPCVFLHVFCIIIDYLNVFPRLPSHNTVAMLLLLETECRRWTASIEMSIKYDVMR